MNSTVSTNYDYISNNITKLNTLTTNCLLDNINTINNIQSDTFQTATNKFNEYTINSNRHYNCVSQMCNLIYEISASHLFLDKNLANNANNLHTNSDFIISAQFISNEIKGLNDYYLSESNLVPYSDGRVNITMDELIEASSNNNVIMASLITELTNNQSLLSQLNTIAADWSNNMQGDVWNYIENDINELITITNNKINYASNLMASMKEAYQTLITHLANYDLTEADTARIPEFINLLYSLQTQEQALQQRLSALRAEHGKPIYDGNGNVVGTIDNSAAIAQCESQLEIIQLAIKETENILACLNALPAKDKQAASSINMQTNDVTSLSSANMPKIPNLLNIPFYYQKDGRWGNYVMSNGGNIAAAGCGYTDVAMILSGLKGQYISPDMMAKYLKGEVDLNNDGVINQSDVLSQRSSGDGLVMESLLTDQFQNSFDVNVNKINVGEGNGKYGIQSAINDGKACLLAQPGHYVIAIPGNNVNANNQREIIVVDPNSANNTRVYQSVNDIPNNNQMSVYSIENRTNTIPINTLTNLAQISGNNTNLTTLENVSYENNTLYKL